MDELQVNIADTIARLDQWLQTMRGVGGYRGPISHWWETSLIYCGPMADWRYEGIICGYINLYRASGQIIWLERARHAGDDLVAAQLPSGKFRNSAFQQGPMEGGTPHEAAVDAGLLELAQLLREVGDETWLTYFETACRNIERYLLAELWNGTGFRDQPWNQVLVPNKNATIAEALILFEALSGRDMSTYLDGAAKIILSAQVQSGLRSGATIHLGTGPHRLSIGLYTARSMCGLLRIYERQPKEELLDAVSRALNFLRGLFSPHGLYFGLYQDGSLIANPRLIAGSGDILRLMIWSCKYGLGSDEEVAALVELFIRSQLPSGSIPTGYGFAERGGHHEHEGLPEFRDVLSVVGWCDKVLRALSLLSPQMRLDIQASNETTELVCSWKGKECKYLENENEICLSNESNGQVLYNWQKNKNFPDIYAL